MAEMLDSYWTDGLNCKGALGMRLADFEPRLNTWAVTQKDLWKLWKEFEI